MGFNGIYPLVNLTFCHGKIHHAINGKVHYFDWAIFNCYLYVHQRVRILMTKRPVTFCYKMWQILGTLAEIALKELTLKTWSESSESSAKKPTTCA